jgi:hypothetical protein
MSCLSPTESRLSPQTSTVLVQRHLGNDNWLSEFTNDFNEVRRKRVKGLLDLNASLDIWKLTQLYQEWVLDDNEIIIKGTNTETGEEKWVAVKAAKRGNDVDAYRITRRLRCLRDTILSYTRDEEDQDQLRQTRAVYVTMTIDPRLVEYDLDYAWRYLAYWFNLFKAKLAKRCGTVQCYVDEKGEFASRVKPCKISVLRSWESHESGWPHIHAILCFEDFHWGIFPTLNKKGRTVWRVKLKDVFEDAWPYGWVDVIALTPGTVEKNIENVVWYVGKNLSDMDYRLISTWPRKRLLTQSILWYYGMRSFAVSGCLLKDDDFTPSDDLNKRTCVTQTTIEGDELVDSPWEWELVGLIRRKDTELHRDDWAKVYVEPPDWLDQVWKPNKRYEGEWWGKAVHHNPNASVPWGSP